MELLYLLCSILSTTVTSLFLSLLLPFRYLLRRVFTPRATLNRQEHVALYQGTVWHERRRPVHHSFSYSVRFLLTIPPSVGYEQNPLSLYYCYEVEGSNRTLSKCIAEVTNTPWGERVTFLFNPNSDLVAKPLHVSPFMHPKLGNYFTASLTAKRVASSTSEDHSRFFWLMPHKVALWIYWHALKLWWKNVSFIQHPRYHDPMYRESALIRNENIQLCPSFVKKEAQNLQIKGPYDSTAKISNNRCIMWSDAPWPWC